MLYKSSNYSITNILDRSNDTVTAKQTKDSKDFEKSENLRKSEKLQNSRIMTLTPIRRRLQLSNISESSNDSSKSPSAMDISGNY